MRPFVIEIYWPDMTSELVAGLVARAANAAGRDESAIRYVGCAVAPRDETCFLRVVAQDGEAVQDFANLLGVNGARVSEVVDVPPPVRGAMNR